MDKMYYSIAKSYYCLLFPLDISQWVLCYQDKMAVIWKQVDI